MERKRPGPTRLKVPAGHDSIAFGDDSWQADKDGVIEVENKELADHLVKDGGCTPAPAKAVPAKVEAPAKPADLRKSGESLTVVDLKAALDEANVAYPADAKKADLVALYDALAPQA